MKFDKFKNLSLETLKNASEEFARNISDTLYEKADGDKRTAKTEKDPHVNDSTTNAAPTEKTASASITPTVHPTNTTAENATSATTKSAGSTDSGLAEKIHQLNETIDLMLTSSKQHQIELEQLKRELKKITDG
jgi:uncharacterized protein (DUF3084 family)